MSRRNPKVYPPPKVQHIIPPFFMKTSACGFTADPRNIEIDDAVARLRERFGVLPHLLTPEQVATLVSETWCGNCLNYCFDLGEWDVENRQFVSEDPTNPYSTHPHCHVAAPDDQEDGAA